MRSNRPRILLTNSTSSRDLYYGEAALRGLRELGEVVLNETDLSLSPEAMIEAAQHCEIIVSDRTTTGPAEVFAALPDLVAFCRCAVDIRNIDVEAASDAGVLVTHATPGFVDSVAELVIGFMVDLSRGVTKTTMAYHQARAPEVLFGRQLSSSTLGIIGYGRIARRVAELARAFGMTVLAHDPYAEIDDAGVEAVSKDEVLARSDFLLPLAVATPETENLMNQNTLAAMKQGAFLVNVSRGNLVDEDALADALRSGHLAGAALDVGRAADQMPSPELARLPNVIATPHIGGATPDAAFHQAADTVRQVAEIIRGQLPEGSVNADRATRLSVFENV